MCERSSPMYDEPLTIPIQSLTLRILGGLWDTETSNLIQKQLRLENCRKKASCGLLANFSVYVKKLGKNAYFPPHHRLVKNSLKAEYLSFFLNWVTWR